MAGTDPTSNKYTRRSHIVRIDMDGGTAPPDGASTATNYIDVEVLDAIAFRDDRNKEMILNLSALPPVPYITDDTGGNHGKTPDASVATRRSHMKRITNGSSKLDVEVIDVIAFRDNLGHEWILNMPDDGSVSVYNKTDRTGDTEATRRVHTEKVSTDLTTADPSTYLNVIRNDNIAFRTVLGKEMILTTPSSNDPNSSDPAAVTFTTPRGYDPQNENGPTPPPNRDPNVYVAAVDGADFFTNSEKIMQGPLWWIRKVSSSPVITITLSFTVTATATAFTPPISIVPMPDTFASTDDLFNKTHEELDIAVKDNAPAPPTTIAGGLSSFYQFGLVDPVVTHTPPVTTTVLFWVIDTSQWSYLIEFGSPLQSVNDFIDFLMTQGLVGPPGSAFAGQLLTRDQVAVNVVNQFPNPPDPQFFEDGGTAHQEPETITQVSSNGGDMVFYIPVGPLRAKLGSDAVFTFSINSTALLNGSGTATAAAETSVGGKPPTGDGPFEADTSYNFGGGADFSVDLKTLNVTVTTRGHAGGGR